MIKRINDIQNLVLNPDSFPIDLLNEICSSVKKSWEEGGKLVLFGNGGSAAEATHIAAEFTGRCVVNHRPFAALSLNDSVSSMTAIANDFGIKEIFARQVEALVNKEDVLIALTTSGKSPNIIKGIEAASKKQCQIYVWTGHNQINISGVTQLNVPSLVTPRIQEIHLMWGHLIAELIEIENI
jgi:D-sedoheptulose 7-phosphate isomerase